MSPDRLFELATASVEAALRLESALDERANGRFISTGKGAAREAA